MFAAFARRLTAWYVGAAVVMVFVLLSVLAVVGLLLYVRILDDGVRADAREASAVSARAAARHQPFIPAALSLERRLARPGIRMLAVAPPPPRARPPVPGPHEREGPPRTLVMDGEIVRAEPRSIRLRGSSIGFAVATLFGSRFQRVDFDGGDLWIQLDPDLLEHTAILLLLGILVVGAIAGGAATFTARYITDQALEPLVQVTAALQRFAAGDFAPQPIAVAGKSEFDAVALAYNAAAAQVAAAFAERQAAEQQMRQFVADAGHELRTPLTIVLGYFDLLRKRAADGDERSRRIFGAIAAEGARMRTLIDNLVLLARMESDQPRPVEPFALGALIDEIVDARRLIAPSVAFGVELDGDAMIIGERNEIHEAIANLVDNALKYAPGSPIEIASHRNGSTVEITIADRGPGVHPEDREAIFDRFYRGASRGDVEGSGLGLAIAKRAAERAGGTLRLAASSPSGTTFALRLRTDPAAVPPRRRADLRA